jgi:hypothetical protein
MDDATAKALRETLELGGLGPDSVLYRETREEFLTHEETSGAWVLSANPDPSEAVVDVYEGGHTSLAAQIGPGLAFTVQADNQWVEEGRISVAMRLGDALDQGGLVYPVESVITESVWYVTLPTGSVRVTRV